MQFLIFKHALVSIKNLYIKAERIDNFYENDLRHMKNIENLELHCNYDKLELNFDNLLGFNKLKRIVLDTDSILLGDMVRQVKTWKKYNSDLDVILGKPF